MEVTYKKYGKAINENITVNTFPPLLGGGRGKERGKEREGEGKEVEKEEGKLFMRNIIISWSKE